ncbi:Arabinanase/levansucrase/invertase [Microthyrium microscopicum]|uniref:Arabinanase/levansucrase/invertase n=1 Tax=Microthyrium microscopicum TaxID=703497 RepID=A0A6A6UF29_9PEZI|nr:Arabinanase/levansucrase/invertase [Microthyrium microscopicum]
MDSAEKSWEKLRTPHITHHQVPQLRSFAAHIKRPWISLLAVLILQYLYFGGYLIFPFVYKYAQDHDNHPNLHFTLPVDWLGAPNGLFIDANKIWHVYFEFESTAPDPEPCRNWGHAISTDLYDWKMQPIAIQCDEYESLSGSVVIDENNTSGFFPKQKDGVVAIYTQYHLTKKTKEQALAYSTDGGFSFTKYANNLPLATSMDTESMHDPKVIWHSKTQKWIMVIAKKVIVEIYTSSNLLDWTFASVYKNQNLVGSRNEFNGPNLVPIPRVETTGAKNWTNLPTIPGGEVLDFGDYILLVSSARGSPLNGGSITRYFPGKFNGTHFSPVDDRTDRFIDFGPDNHASQFFFGLADGAPVISLGWASNLQYAGSVRTGSREGWRGILTGPREGYLIHNPSPHGADESDLSYFGRPVGLEGLKDEVHANITVRQALDQSVAYTNSEAILIEAKYVMMPDNADPVEINLDLVFKSSSGEEQLLCSVIFGTWMADFVCDRSQASKNWTLSDPSMNQMMARQVPPLLPFHNPASRRWEFQAIMDRSILEVYLNGGVKAGTITMFPSTPLDIVHLRSKEIPGWANLTVTVQRLRARNNELLR